MAQPKKDPAEETRIMVRLGRDLHSRLKAAAALSRKELAEALDEAVLAYLDNLNKKRGA